MVCLKYQLFVFKELWKKSIFKYFIIFIIFQLLILIYFFALYERTQESLALSLGLLASTSVDLNLVEMLWVFFQVLWIIYISLKLVSFEENNSPEFTILREKYITLARQRVLFIIAFVILMRVFLFLFLYSFYFKAVKISFCLFLKNILYFLFISLIECMLYYKINIKKRNVKKIDY